MSKSSILIVKQDQQTGEIGVVVDGVSVNGSPMVAREGILVAHDLFEHVNGLKNIGTVGDELEALGGIWYIRGRHGDIRRDGLGSMYTPTESIGSEFTQLYPYYHRSGHYGIPVPRTYKHDADEDFKDIINHGKESTKGESEYYEWNCNNLKQFCQDTKHFLRSGYNKAKRKYQHTNINMLFWDVAEAVDEICNYIEFEGQEFKLTYSMSNEFRPYCEEHYNDEYY